MSEPESPESPESPETLEILKSPEAPEEPKAPEEQPGQGDSVDDLFEVLSSPLDDDDLTAVLTRRPRAKLPSLTLVLAAIVVAGAGFLVGALVGKHYGSSGSGNLAAEFSRLAARPTTSGGSAGAGSGLGAGAGTGGRGGLFGGGNATVGTIKLIDGATVYVQTTAGDIVQVATSAGTKVTVSSTVPVKDLRPGETVIVLGSKNSSGAIAATSISQTSLGGGFGG
jgi:hypothetical protein